LIESYTPDDISDIENIVESITSTRSEISENEADAEVKYWTKGDLERRVNISNIWKDIANGPCHRKPILIYLEKRKLPEDI